MTNIEITPAHGHRHEDGEHSVDAAGRSRSRRWWRRATYVNGTGVVPTPGFQTLVAGGEDADGGWGVIGSAPGAASVTHSWNLRADAAGRFAYLVSFSINPAAAAARRHLRRRHDHAATRPRRRQPRRLAPPPSAPS